LHVCAHGAGRNLILRTRAYVRTDTGKTHACAGI